MMSKNNCKSASDEDLKVFMGRVLTLLGDIDNKVNFLVDEFVPTEEQQMDRPDVADESNGEWSDG